MTLDRAEAIQNFATRSRRYHIHNGHKIKVVFQFPNLRIGNQSHGGRSARPRISMRKAVACGAIVIAGGAAFIVLGGPAVAAAGGAAALKGGIGATYAMLKGLAAKSAAAAALA